MSELNGLFSLRTPRDLFGKLEADFSRLRDADPTHSGAQYAAFDFFVTAHHLPDWLSHPTGASLSSSRNYPDGSLVNDIANGAKHFSVDPKRHTTVSDTKVRAGIFDSNIFDPHNFDVSSLVIDLENGSAVDVLEVAVRVLDHWRKEMA